MKTKSIVALALVVLSGTALAGKNKTRRDTPRYNHRPGSPINPGLKYVMRLMSLGNDITDIDRRSPLCVPGALLDFYTGKMELCGTMFITLKEFQEQVIASTLSEIDIHKLIVKKGELYDRVTTIFASAQSAHAQCKSNPFMELSRSIVEQ